MTSKEIKDITTTVATLVPSVQKDSHPLTCLGPIGHAPPSGQKLPRSFCSDNLS